MTTTELAIAPDPVVVGQKRNAWSQMGEVVYISELKLQAMVQQTLAKLTFPESIEDVQEAEVLLKDLKASQREIEKQRKEITGRFDEVASRLMQNEKSLTEPIAQLSGAIIALKKEYEKQEALRQAKQTYLSQVRQKVASALAQTEANFQSKIEAQINRAYSYALGEGNVTPENLDAYLAKCKEKFSEADFTVTPPTMPLLNGATEQEVNAIVQEVFVLIPAKYIQEYKGQLDWKFSDYSVAFLNKQEAIERASREEAARQKAIEDEKANRELAARMEANSQTMDSFSHEVKALRKSYEVDMPETVESVIQIMAAFTANLPQCLSKLKVNKWFAFTPAQAATALSKLKCDDNNFSPAGIRFKEVDKL